jgi:hypothetical protein
VPTKSKKRRPRHHHALVVSKSTKPSIRVRPGMALDVVAVSLVEPTLKRAKRIAARLCGSSSTCVALVKTD